MPIDMPVSAADALQLIQDSYNIGADAARRCIIALARQAMREDDRLREFIMANGVAYFVMPNGKMVDAVELDADLADVLKQWDDVFHMTGDPARFTADGKIITDW